MWRKEVTLMLFLCYNKIRHDLKVYTHEFWWQILSEDVSDSDQQKIYYKFEYNLYL